MIIEYVKEFILWFIITFSFLFFVLFLFKKRRIKEKNWIYGLALVAYLVALCSVTLFPTIEFGIDGITGRLYIDLTVRNDKLRSINLIPFKTILSELMGANSLVGSEDKLAVSVLNLLGNLALFAPVGFMLSMMKSGEKSRGFMLVVTVIVSCSIEILQYVIGRSADIDDVILRILGAGAGYGISKMLATVIRFDRRNRKQAADRNRV